MQLSIIKFTFIFLNTSSKITFYLFVSRLGCECAKKAKEGGYVAFALGFYGECFAANDQAKYLEHVIKQSPSSKCIGHDYAACNNEASEECIGGAGAEYIYTFPSAAPVGMYRVAAT